MYCFADLIHQIDMMALSTVVPSQRHRHCHFYNPYIHTFNNAARFITKYNHYVGMCHLLKTKERILKL